jgi:hypothetical protein
MTYDFGVGGDIAEGNDGIGGEMHGGPRVKLQLS